ncbi:MAG: Asp-tRNA(Asn)/Glu-tRNA(Gln) amidotransferase subunit GatB [Patescibacteria group bacterium]
MKELSDKNLGRPVVTKYETVIGLEIHVELATKTKMFCGCRNDPFGALEPNLYICPVCLGLPGSLPVMNRQAVEWTVLVGLALGCEIGFPENRKQKTENRTAVRHPSSVIRHLTKWDRKNYFYPDLPKGYQISQFDLPICRNGELRIRNKELGEKGIEITRIHLEEDTGKLVHPVGKNYSLIDYNRAGVPLMELVTEPVIRSGEEAAAFAELYQLVLRTLGVSDADMEKGQMRVEANISVRPLMFASTNPKSQIPNPKLGTKVEVKNLNSLRSVQRAIAYETKRQIEVIESGGTLVQETRGWDEAKQQTFTQRVKETAADYRYFPEPDLPPVTFNDRKSEIRNPASPAGGPKSENKGIDIEDLRSLLPELPWEKIERFVNEYKVNRADAVRLVADLPKSRYFEAAAATNLPMQPLVNWILNELLDLEIEPAYLTELVSLLADQTITTKLAKDLLSKMRSSGHAPRSIIKQEGLEVVRDSGAITVLAAEVIAANPQAVADWQAGKAQALGYLVGQVMAKSRGQADPNAVRVSLQQILNKEGNNDISEKTATA